MSDIMLHGVLNTPPDLWTDSEIDKIQRHSRYVEASERIKQLEYDNEFLLSKNKELYKRYKFISVTSLSISIAFFLFAIYRLFS